MMISAAQPCVRMQSITEASVAGRRALSLKAGITMLYFGSAPLFGPAFCFDSSVTFPSPVLKSHPLPDGGLQEKTLVIINAAAQKSPVQSSMPVFSLPSY